MKLADNIYLDFLEIFLCEIYTIITKEWNNIDERYQLNFDLHIKGEVLIGTM